MRYRTSGAVVLAVVLLAMCGGGGVTPPPHYPDCSFRTGNNASVFVESSVLADLNGGDQLAVFTADGLCVGTDLYRGSGNALGITVWGDDSITPEKDGAAAGDSLYFRAYTDRRLTVTYADSSSSGTPMNTTGLYVPDGLYTLSSIGITGDIAAAQAVIDSLYAANTLLETQLSASQAQLTASQAQVAQLSNDLAVLQADYVDLSDRVDEAVELLTQ